VYSWDEEADGEGEHHVTLTKSFGHVVFFGSIELCSSVDEKKS